MSPFLIGGVLLGSLGSVAVVEQQDVVRGQVFRRQVARGGLGYIHLVARPGQEFLDEGGGLTPLMVLVSRDDQNLDRPGVSGTGRAGHEEQSRQGGEQYAHDHSSVRGGLETAKKRLHNAFHLQEQFDAGTTPGMAVRGRAMSASSVRFKAASKSR